MLSLLVLAPVIGVVALATIRRAATRSRAVACGGWWP